MNINPSSPHGSSAADSARAELNRAREGAEASNPAQVEAKRAEAREARGDSLDVSEEAKALSTQANDTERPAGLSADRLKQIGERLATGYYDRPDVIADVANRVAQDPEFRS